MNRLDGGTIVNDVTRLNPVQVWAVAAPTSIAEVQDALRRADGPVSVGGGHFSMGGQTASPGSLHLDMRRMNRILAFHPQARTVRVEAGVRWCDLQRFIDGHRSKRDPIGQRRPFHEFHHQRVQAFVVFERVDAGDIRMIERGEHLRFANEASQTIGVTRHLGKQQLQRHIAIEIEIAGAKHTTHAACADRRQDFVVSEEASRR